MPGVSELEPAGGGADNELVVTQALNHGAYGGVSGSELQRVARFGGLLMVLASLLSFPAGIVLEPPPQAHEHLIGAGSALLGLAFMFAPWERLSANWLHLFLVVGAAEIAAGVAVFSDDYAFFYVLLGMYAAYVIRDRRWLVAYMALFTLILCLPLLYAQDDLKAQAHHILVTFPVFLIAAMIVTYLRDTLEQRERQYRGFAFEAVELAERIRGTGDGDGEADDELIRRLDRLAAKESHEVDSGS